MSKKALFGLLLLLLLLAPASLAQDDEIPTIAMMNFGYSAGQTLATKGAFDILQAYGYFNEEERLLLDEGKDLFGENMNVLWRNAGSDTPTANLMVEDALDRGVDAMLIVTTQVTQIAVNATRDMEDPPAIMFSLVGEESEARYIIDEELLGQPKTVVGTTNAISGELTVDPANPAASFIGPIQIEAGTFVTDSNRRDGAVRRFVLQTSQYQFITFTATAYVGLPDAAAIGDEIQFEVTGDLTVRDITRPAIFIVTMQVVSESELRGNAATIIVRDDYELRIPAVPSVANVGEEFIVEFDFVARAQ